jgi:bifunctional non-homologous end joining protein LigD
MSPRRISRSCCSRSFDGELVAFGNDGKPDFPSLCERILHRHGDARAAFVIFDVLSVEGSQLIRQPYRERRRILETHGLAGTHWQVPEAFDDGAALWVAVSEQELEGRRGQAADKPYLPGERGWVKVKNRGYWRYELSARAHYWRGDEPLC